MFQEWAPQVLRRVRTVTLRWVLKRDRSKPWRLHGDSMGPWPWALTSLCSSEACREESGSRQGRVLSSLGWYSWRTQGQTLSVISRNRFHAVSCKFHQKPPLNSCFLAVLEFCEKGFWMVPTCQDLFEQKAETERHWDGERSLLKLAEALESKFNELSELKKNKKNKFNPFRVVPRRSLTTSSPPGRRRRLDAILRPLSGGARGKQRLGKFPKTWQFQEVCKKYARSMQEGSEVRSLYKFITCCFWYLWCLPFKSSLTDFGACLFACWQFLGRKSNEDFVFLCVSAVFLLFFAGVQLLQVQNKLDLPNAEGTGLFRAHEARRG